MKKIVIISIVVLGAIAFVYWKMNGFSKAIDEAVEKE